MRLAGEADNGVCGRRWETWGTRNAPLGYESSSSCASGSPSISPEPSFEHRKTPTSPHCATGAAHGELESADARPGKRAKHTFVPDLPGTSKTGVVGSGFEALNETRPEQSQGVHRREPHPSLPYEKDGFRRVELTALSQLQVRCVHDVHDVTVRCV
jgi:hypothetical protein